MGVNGWVWMGVPEGWCERVGEVRRRWSAVNWVCVKGCMGTVRHPVSRRKQAHRQQRRSGRLSSRPCRLFAFVTRPRAASLFALRRVSVRQYPLSPCVGRPVNRPSAECLHSAFTPAAGHWLLGPNCTGR
eukprot:scaffold12244_cov216-Isochrysis_galbana.AAC.15